MADNTAVYNYPGGTSYDNIATEDIGGKKHQKIRLNIGAPGAESILAKGQQAMANSVPVVLASDQPAAALPTGASTEATLLALKNLAATEATLALIKTATQLMALWDVSGRAKVSQQKSSSSTCVIISYVAGSVNLTLLAANANRLGATIFNNATTGMSLRLGAGATTSWTVLVPSQGYYEVPFGYTGIIDCFWVTGGSGNALVTELLP